MPASGDQTQLAQARALVEECLALALLDQCLGLARKCATGKPCGNTCIPVGHECHQGGAAAMTKAGRRRLALVESQIRHRKSEVGVAMDREGVEIVRRAAEPGAPHRLEFDREELTAMRGSIYTHTHPSDAAFPAQDVLFACRAQLAELRAAGPRFTYSLRPAAGDFNDALWRSTSAELTAATAAVRAAWRQKKAAHGAESVQAQKILQIRSHKSWQKIARRLNLVYSRSKA